MGQRFPLDTEEGFEFSLGFESTLDLQRSEMTKTVDIGGGLSAPTSSERSKGAKPHEGAGSTSLAADLSVTDGCALSSDAFCSDDLWSWFGAF
jgi:hypothetical protein